MHRRRARSAVGGAPASTAAAPGLALALLAAAALSPDAAQAQPLWDTPSPQGFTLPPRSGAAGELSFWTGNFSDEQAWHVSGLLRGGLVLEEVLELGLTVGGAWTLLPNLQNEDFGFEDSDIADGGHAGAAMPVVSVVGIAGEQRWRLRFGGAATIPIGLASPGARLAVFYGGAVRGMSELWLWAADRTSALGIAQLQLMPLDHFYLEASAQGGLLISTRSGTRPTSEPGYIAEDVAESSSLQLDATVDLHVAAALRSEDVFGGLRFRSVITPTLESDVTQLSLEAFLRGTFGIDDTSIEAFVEGRFTANLDPSLGFSELGVWGAHLAFGLGSTPAQIPDGRYGVASVEVEGAEQLSGPAVVECLGTRRRGVFGVDIGLAGAPSCNEPPFDGDNARIDLFSWPFTEWPLFDENIFERDIERVERWYRARGYYDARVTDAEVDPPSASTMERGSDSCGEPGDDDCEVDVTFTVEEGEPVRIARMSLRGIDELPDGMREVLREQLPFESGEPFDETLYERTKSRMVRALAEAGYADARVDGDVKINVGRHEAFLVFSVDAGPPTVLGEICVVGHRELPAQTLLYVSGLEPGDEFSLLALEEAQRRLYQLGVLGSVDIHPESEEEAGEADGDDEPMDDGDRERTDPTELEDQDSDAVLAEATTAQLGREQRTRGERVCSDPPDEVPEGSQATTVVIEVRPGDTERLAFGVGFQAGQAVSFGTVTTVSQVQAAAQWDLHLSINAEARNLFGEMIRTRIEARPRFLFNMPVLSFEPAQPFPLGALVNGSARWPVFAGVRWLTLAHQFSVDLGPAPFTNFFRLNFDALFGPEASFFDQRLYLGLFAHVNYFLPIDRQPVLPEQQLPETYASWIEETIRVDLRDDPRSPTLGAYFAVTSQQGFQPLSNWTLVRLTAEARGYVPLFAGIVLAGRFQIGLMEVFDFDRERLVEGNIYQLDRLGPTNLHLIGGGASSNRGYLPGLLGDATQVYVSEAPTDQDLLNGVPGATRPVRISGGQRLWLASLELRVPITQNLGVVAFGDVGDVNRQRLDEDEVSWRWDHIQLAVGLGVRYQTIIGPIRFDIAVRPDQTQVVGGDGTLPRECTEFDAGGSGPCRPPSQYFQIGDLAIPGAFHLTIGESF